MGDEREEAVVPPATVESSGPPFSAEQLQWLQASFGVPGRPASESSSAAQGGATPLGECRFVSSYSCIA